VMFSNPVGLAEKIIVAGGTSNMMVSQQTNAVL